MGATCDTHGGFQKWVQASHSLTSRLYGPLRALPSLISEAHTSLSTSFCNRFLPFTSHSSFSTSSSHLNLGLHLFLLPSGLFPNIFLTLHPDSFLLHVQSIPVCATMSRSLNNSLSSWSVLTLHIARSTTCPYVLIFVSLMCPVLS